MKQIVYTTLLCTLITWGCSHSERQNYDADLILSESEKKEMMYRIIRYLGHLPPRATHETKFDSEYDTYYQDLADRHSLEMAYHHPEENQLYFLITREAPSLYSKQVAAGGRLSLDSAGELTFYEEVFRTWKLSEDELAVKSSLLFQEMIAGKDLSIYYPEHSGSEEVIEFPNNYTRFDTATRRWVSSRFDPSAEFTP